MSFGASPLACLLAVFACVLATRAEGRNCEGPKECCFAVLATELPQVQSVSLGAVFVGVYNVNERAGTWDADFYLYESWKPAQGFTPQTEIVNEVTRLSEEFDTVGLHQGRCIRSRRLRSTLHSPLDLRLFPFDTQTLTLSLSDTWFEANMARYEDRPSLLGLDAPARRQLSQWEVTDQGLRYSREQRAFEWEAGIWDKEIPAYDYAEIALRVKRRVTFHLAKYFFPLMVIVAIAMSVFWVAPEDLDPQITLGVTCLLAAIAFQLTQASTLPEVAYLTLADKIYAICYLTISLSLGESLYANNLARAGKREQATRVDRFCRRVFPAGLVACVALVMLQTFLRAR